MGVHTDLDPDTEALAAGFIAAIEAGDTARLYECCADDVVIWHNTDNAEVNLDHVARILSWLAKNVRDFCYTGIRRRAFAGGYLQQHVLTGIAPSGEDLRLPACLVVHVAAGRIARIEEYLDSAGAAVLQRPAAT